MRKVRAVFAVAVFAASLCASVAAQGADPGITPNGVIGEVAAVDAGSKQIFVKTDAGSVVIASLSDATQILRNPPGEKGLDKAAPMTLAELTAGDRVFAMGAVSADRKTVAARRVVVNTKAELEKKREAERAEWQRRGIVGVVSALDPQTKEITIQTRGPQGPQSVVIAASAPGLVFRRYAPDSIKFADAKPSSFDELKTGDQLRAKGERSEDGSRFTPEEVVTGSFRTSVGTITAVNAEKGEITIKQAQGDQTLTVVVRPDSVMKQFQLPPEMAAMMGGGGPGAGGGERRVIMREGAGGGGQGGGQGQQGGAQGQGGPPGGARRMFGPDLQQMIERLPAASLAELQTGQMIVVSSTVGADPSRVTAIQLVSNIEPLVAMMSRRQGGGQGGGQNALGGFGAAGNISFGFGIGQP